MTHPDGLLTAVNVGLTLTSVIGIVHILQAGLPKHSLKGRSKFLYYVIRAALACFAGSQLFDIKYAPTTSALIVNLIAAVLAGGTALYLNNSFGMIRKVFSKLKK